MSAGAATPARIIEVRADSEDAVPQKADNKAKAADGGAAAADVGKAAAGKPAAPGGAEHSGKPAAKPAAPAASAAPAAAAAPAPAAPAPSKPVSRPRGDGLSEENLTQIAQAKFEAQEEKLRDVARQSMALLRDYKRLSPGDCDRRVAEIRKSLLKYEMQYIRAWANQEKRRRLETEVWEAEAERCRQEAEEEGGKIVELRQVLEKERRRRKRYESYEKLAEEVNRKKSRAESQAEIDAATAEIERVKRKRSELEALGEERNQRAQLLRQAVAELKQDLQREQDLGGEVTGGVAAGAGNRSGGDKASQPAGSQTGAAGDVEVIS